MVLGDSYVAAQRPVSGIWEGGFCVGSHSPSITVTPHEMVRLFRVPSTLLADFLEFAVEVEVQRGVGYPGNLSRSLRRVPRHLTAEAGMPLRLQCF